MAVWPFCQVKLAEKDVDFLCSCILGITEAEGTPGVVDEKTIQKGVLDCINNPKVGAYYLAYVEGDEEQEPIGSTGVTYEMNPRLGGIICWLETVYTVPEMRKKGVFTSLFNHVVEWAISQTQIRCVRLTVT